MALGADREIGRAKMQIVRNRARVKNRRNCSGRALRNVKISLSMTHIYVQYRIIYVSVRTTRVAN